MLVFGSAHAAKFGHSRLISAAGEPLRVAIPVTQINAADAASLRVTPAPASEWINTGLTPPVDLSTLQTRLIDGQANGTRVIQVWSDQIFDKPIADLLLDVHTSSGVQRYQVSLLARGGAAAIQAPVASEGASARRNRSVASGSESFLTQKPVLIRQGDTMFSVAQRHAVPGVSVYQMMIALLRANPHAFIQNNLNLVRAGEQMSMPDMAALTAISDREARRLFHEQVVAFGLYRRSPDDQASGDLIAVQPVAQDARESAPAEPASNVPESRVGAGDQLKLSSGRTATASGSNESIAENSISADGASTGAQALPSDTQTDGTTQRAEAAMAPEAHAATAATTSAMATPSAGAQQQSDNAASADPANTAETPATPSGSGPSNVSAATQSTSAVTPDASAPASVQSSNSAAQPLTSVQPSAGSTSSVTATAKDGLTDNDGTQADDAVATRKAVDDAQKRVSQLEENVKNLNRALQSQGEAAKDLIVDGAIGLRQSLTDVATAVTDATIGDEDLTDTSSDPAKTAEASSNTQTSTSERRQTDKTGSVDSMIAWVQGHLLAVITAILAFIVLAIAWGLRRANVAQSSSDNVVTPEMVKEKLDQINLDLNEPTVGDSSSSRS